MKIESEMIVYKINAKTENIKAVWWAMLLYDIY